MRNNPAFGARLQQRRGQCSRIARLHDLVCRRVDHSCISHRVGEIGGLRQSRSSRVRYWNQPRGRGCCDRNEEGQRPGLENAPATRSSLVASEYLCAASIRSIKPERLQLPPVFSQPHKNEAPRRRPALIALGSRWAPLSSNSMRHKMSWEDRWLLSNPSLLLGWLHWKFSWREVKDVHDRNWGSQKGAVRHQ